MWLSRGVKNATLLGYASQTLKVLVSATKCNDQRKPIADMLENSPRIRGPLKSQTVGGNGTVTVPCL